VAERVRQTVENHQFRSGDTFIPVTISAGVATKKPEDQDWSAIYQRADKALYLSKNTGRNRVSVAS
jgi:diguanylate cyclase (GGDEF)-like protein